MSTIPHTPKRTGEWVELQFMARATAHGLVVSKPWGDSTPYDFVVEAGGCFQRVQVKSSSHRAADRRHRPYGYTCLLTYSRGRHRYGRQVDFFAFYILPEDLWFIIPAAALRHRRAAIYPDPHHPRNPYFRYLEAWHLLLPRRSPDSSRAQLLAPPEKLSS